MTAVYERALRVRHYECDPHGHLNHANYLRYMQEAAFEASAAVGYDLAAYEKLGRHWLVHGTDITFLRPLVYGQTAVIKTWVADFRRATSRRRYELREQAGGQLVAEASTDWILLDTVTGRPAAIPPEMVTAFAPDGLPEVARAPFPPQPDPPPGLFRMIRRVRWNELDPAGHVNNAVYLSYLEDCALDHRRAVGWPASRMLADGYGIFGRRVRLQYLAPALLDEELEVTTWLSPPRRATVVRHYAIRRLSDEQQLLRADGLWVWVDLASGRPSRIPAAFQAAFADSVAAEIAAS